MASEHDFHLGPKTEHAQGDLLDKAEYRSAAGQGSEAADVADKAGEKAQESKEHAGNIFQKAGDAIKGTVSETVHEVQNKLGKSTSDPAKMPLEE